MFLGWLDINHIKRFQMRNDAIVSYCECRMTIRNLEMLRKMAKKYIWWEMPDNAVARPASIVAQVMNIGDFEDVRELINDLGDSFFCDVIKTAEAGQFNERSWAYWHYRLGLVKAGHVPALPLRKIQ